MARLRVGTLTALLLFAQFCVAALAKKGVKPGFETNRQGLKRTVVQTGGSAELVERYFLHWEANVSLSEVEYFQTSSHEDCLSVSHGMENVLATKTSHGTNVTSTLTFDNMVGVVKYTIGIRLKGSKKIIYSKTIEYTVVGMVLYRKNNDGSKSVLNAEGSDGFKISYQDAANKVVKESNKIYCSIQYADGSSSDSLPKGATKIPKGATLLSSAPVVGQQFHHSKSSCDADVIGSYSPTKGIVLPNGCGFGFYWDLNGNLCFGFDFKPYHSGKARLHFAWSGLTESRGDPTGEIYDCDMNVDVTGTPPVVVTGVEPANHPFRYEGGETLKCTFFNTDIHSVSKYRLEIAGGKFCHMVPGSLKSVNGTDHVKSAIFVVAPGRGGPHKTSLQYAEANATTSTTSTFKNAIMPDNLVLTYDERPLVIEDMSPIRGNKNGGTKITLLGYFAGFRPDRDAIDFSGVSIPRHYISSWSSHTIEFTLPPKSMLGSAFEYEVCIHVGNGVSKKVRFFYGIKGSKARISQSGTSYLRENTYRIGNCSPARFTLVQNPLTAKQIIMFKWILKPANSTNTNLFNKMKSLQNIDTSQQTIEIHPHMLGNNGSFILTGIIVMQGSSVEKDITLQRDNMPSIGAFILQPSKRFASYPRAPVRLHAIVSSPGQCSSGPSNMRVEWTVFGKKYSFSSEYIQEEVNTGYRGIHISRLGRELIIPTGELVPGSHNVKFRVWMANETSIFGRAETVLHIMKDNIVPVIRYGEREIQANWATNLNIFATNSYDPDLDTQNRSRGISYRWACNQSVSSSFPEEGTKPCPPAILPESVKTKASFTVRKEILKQLGNYSYLRFFLSASKNNDTQNAMLDCEVLTGGTKPMLDVYKINMEDSGGHRLPNVNVPTYDDVIFRPSALNNSAWTYELVEPAMPDFKFFELLTQNDLMFKPTGEGNTAPSSKPLGFAPNRLSSFTTYRLRVNFTGDENHAPTSAVLQFKTGETPKVGILKPVPKEGDTTTLFTITAGLPQEDGRFSYFFYATDLEGNRVCIGGCTGYNLIHFKLMRPGTYTLSVSLYDKSGKSMLDEKVFPTRIEIKVSGHERKFISHLQRFFAEGDDVSWTQLANDICVAALTKNPEQFETDMLLGETGRELEEYNVMPIQEQILADMRENAKETPDASLPSPTRAPDSPEEKLHQRRRVVIALVAKGYRGIICSSSPNSKQSRGSIMLLLRLQSVPNMTRETLLNCLFILMCAVENAPPSSAVDVENELPTMIASFYNHAKKIDEAGFNREQLMGETPRPGNLVADIAVVCAKLMVRAIAMGKLDGFQFSTEFGKGGEYGHIALFAGVTADQMRLGAVNGEHRRIVKGRTDDELFYIMPSRFPTVFTGMPTDKRYIALYTVPNFIVRSRLQDPPSGTNLGNDLYWVQMYAQTGIGGRLRSLKPTSDQPAFCMHMPVTHNRAFFSGPMGLMPGMYAAGDIKKVGEVAQGKGEYFNYVYEGMRVVEYNVSKEQNWVEACHTSPSLFGATAVSRIGGEQAVGLDKAVLFGQQGSLLAVLITGALLLLVVVIASAWLIATKTGGPAPRAAPGGYVERDGYGRSAAVDVPADGVTSAAGT